jgi:hypothetical protein
MTPPEKLRIQPQHRWYLFPAALFALCVTGGTLWIVLAIAGAGRGGLLFTAPGSAELEIANPGRYQVWNVNDAVIDGRRFTAPAALPPMIMFRIVEQRTGRQIPLVLPALTVREEQGGPLRASVGTFDAPAPGRYEISVSGSFPSRAFSITRAGHDLLLAFVGGGLLCAAGGIAAPLIAFAIFTRRARNRRKLYGPDF